MRAEKRSNWGGSIVAFIIVGVILTAGLIGAAYYIKRRGDQVSNNQTIVVSDKDKSEEDTKTSTEKVTDSAVNTDDINEPDGEKVSTSSSELPETGPGSFFVSVLGAGLLAVSIKSYLSSRTKLKRSL